MIKLDIFANSDKRKSFRECQGATRSSQMTIVPAAHYVHHSSFPQHANHTTSLQPLKMAEAYVRTIQDYANDHPDDAEPLIKLMALPERNMTKFFYSNVTNDEQPTTISQLLSFVKHDASSSTKGVCVIENISPACIKEVGHEWSINPSFFSQHASNPSQADLWRMWPFSALSTPIDHQCLDGVYLYSDMSLDLNQLQQNDSNYCQRYIYKDSKWHVNSSTRISYCRVTPVLCGFKSLKRGAHCG